MFNDQIEAAIPHASPTALGELSSALWKAHAAGGLLDDEAQRLAELIHARQTVAKTLRETVGRTAHPVGAFAFPPRKVQPPPVRSEAIEKRRRLAATGPMPPALAARFTTSEAAVMRIVGDECRDHGRCDLPLDAIAARAGVRRTTTQNALRLAKRIGMVEIEERRRKGAKNLPNVVKIVDREWRHWLARGPKARETAFKNPSPKDTQGFTGEEKASSSSQKPDQSARRKASQNSKKPRAGRRASFGEADGGSRVSRRP